MKRLVVTGASRGFGREIALKAKEEGYLVFGSVRRIDDAATSLRDAGIRIGLLEMSDEQSVESFIQEVNTWSSGHLDVLVNNAGVAFPIPMEVINSADLIKQFQVNTVSHLRVTAGLMEPLKAARGRVIMVSSQCAIVSTPMTGPYSASKRALEALTEAMTMEVGPEVSFSIVRAGPYATSIWESSEKIADTYEVGQYQSMKNAVRFLAFSYPMKPAKHFADLILRIAKTKSPRFIYTTPFSARLLMWTRRLVPNRCFFAIMRLILARTKRSSDQTMVSRS